MEYLKIDEVKKGDLYEICARNGCVGIYFPLSITNESPFIHTFLLSRHKWSDNFPFHEYHYDDGEPYGTVKPIKKLETVPINIMEAVEIFYFRKTPIDQDQINIQNNVSPIILQYLNKWEEILREENARTRLQNPLEAV